MESAGGRLRKPASTTSWNRSSTPPGLPPHGSRPAISTARQAGSGRVQRGHLASLPPVATLICHAVLPREAIAAKYVFMMIADVQ
jgi:hypothetical protein